MKIECVQATAEESLICFRSNPSFGLKKHLIETEPKFWFDEDALICELELTYGRAVVCICDCKKKLKRLIRKLSRKGRVIAGGFLARVGDDAIQLRTRLANCIRTFCHAFEHKLDAEAETERAMRWQKIHTKRARFATPKNFQPSFS